MTRIYQMYFILSKFLITNSQKMDQFKNKQDFEVHVTISPTTDTEPFINICDTFTDYANKLNIPDAEVISCKPIIIILPEGVNS